MNYSRIREALNILREEKIFLEYSFIYMEKDVYRFCNRVDNAWNVGFSITFNRGKEDENN